MTRREDAVMACAVAILGGEVLQTPAVSVGRGLLIDWEAVPSGEVKLESECAYDQAALFVALVGEDAAAAAARKEEA